MFLAINHRAQCNVLAGDVVIVILKFFGDIEGDFHRIIGKRTNLGDRQRVERGFFLFQRSSH